MLAIEQMKKLLSDPVRLYSQKVIWHHLEANQNIRYITYIPDTVRAESPVMVCMHGISRNAAGHIYGFAPWAERYGFVLVVPLFETKYVAKYQRMARSVFDLRADIILNKIVDEVGRLNGVSTDRLHMFGFSGGAQFVHRYVMLHPHRVASFVAASAGWYTFPDPLVAYPRGTRVTPQLPGLSFVPRDFLQVPGLVLVGDRDTKRDPALKYSPRLVAQQGVNRLERGQRWVAAMTDSAKAHGFDTPYRFAELPGCGHSFERAMIRGGLGSQVIKALFPCW